MGLKLLRRFVVVPQQLLGFRRILAFLVIHSIRAICSATPYSPAAISRSALARPSRAFQAWGVVLPISYLSSRDLSILMVVWVSLSSTRRFASCLPDHSGPK